MSKTIDERVVSMQFDNKNFESNVKTSMSTIDRLKQALRFDNSSKSFDMSPLARGVETVTAKFSALEVMGVTALANITNSAVNAGKRIVASLTIDPITTGFNEYELKMNSIQTMMASTGESLETVNGYLEELNKYSDQTIYSFSDMTQNIGKFTNAGVKLPDAVNAIKGIANAAALSGANANEASRSMYNFAQALSAGYVKLIDWKSIELANMATVEFKEQLLETALAVGTVIKVGDEYRTTTTNANGEVSDLFTSTKNFNEALANQWMTTDVLTKTLSKYADANTDIGARATQAATEIKTFTMMMDTLKESAQSGWAQTWEIIFGDFNEGKSLWTSLGGFIGNIIDKVNTFRNELLKAALDNPLAKMFDEMSEKISKLTGAVDAVSKAMTDYEEIVNRIIKGEYGNGQSRWDKLTEQGYDWAHAQNLVNERLGVSKRHATNYAEAQNGVNSVLENTITKYAEMSEGQLRSLGFTTEEIGTLKEQHKARQKVIEDNRLSEDTLRKLGFTNEQIVDSQTNLNSSVDASIDKYTKMTDQQLQSMGLSTDEISNLRKTSKARKELNKSQESTITILAQLSDSMLRQLGFTQEEAAALHDLAKYAEMTGIPIEELAKDIDKLNGRTLLLNSFKNIGELLVGVFKSLKDAWVEVFPPITAERLYEIIAGFHKFTLALKPSDETLDKLNRTFKGLFSILGIITDVIGAVIKYAFGELGPVVGEAGSHVLDFTANIGDAIVEFREWLNSNNRLTKGIEKVGNAIKKIIDVIKKVIDFIVDVVDATVSLDNVQTAFDNLASSFSGIKEAAIDGLSGLKDTIVGYFKSLFPSSEEAGEDTAAGLKQGLTNGIGKVVEAVFNIATSIINKIKEVLGIHSPSTVMIAIGGFIIAGLVGGLLAGIPDVRTAVSNLGTKIGEFFSNIDWGQIFTAGLSAGILALVGKLISVVDNFSAPFEGVGDLLGETAEVVAETKGKIKKILNQVGNVLKGFSKVLKGIAFEHITEGVKNLAVSLLILVGALAIVAYIAATDSDSLYTALDVITQLTLLLGMLAISLSALSKDSVSIGKSGLSIKGIAPLLISLAATLLIMAGVIKILGTMSTTELAIGLGVTAGLVLLIGMFVAAVSMYGKDMPKISGMLLSLSISLLLFAGIIAIFGTMSTDVLLQGGGAVAALMTLIALFIGMVSAYGKDIPKIAGILLALSGALAIMTIIVSILGNMTPGVLWQGIGAVAALMTLIGLFVGIVSAYGKEMPKIAAMLLGLSAALGIMAIVIKLLGGMDIGELAKGIIAVGLLMTMIGAFAIIVSKYGKDAPKIAATMIAMSIAVGILAAVAVVLGLINLPDLAKGVIAVGILSAVMALMIYAARGVGDCMKSLIVMTVAIAVMAAAVAGLSLLDPVGVAVATVAMVAVMAMFAVILKSADMIEGSIGVLIILTAAVAVLAGCIALLALMPVENVLGSAIALSALLLAMSGALVILKFIGKDITSAISGVLALTAMAVPLIAFVGVLAVMQLVENAQNNVLLLVGLATAMTLLLIPLMLVGALITPALMGVLALTAMAVPLIAFVGILALMEGMQNAQANTDLLTSFMVTMVGLLMQLAIVAPLALVAVAAVTALTGLMVVIGALVIGIGALMETFPQLETFLDSGIDLLVKLAGGIGSMIGAFINGALMAATEGLPDIGKRLSDFMLNANDFIMGAKLVDSSVLEGVGVLARAIIALVAADLIAGVASFFSMESSFADLGTELSNFMNNAKDFIDGSKLIDSAVIDSATSLVDVIMTLTAADLLSSVTSFLTGSVSFEKLGTQLTSFGSAVVAFSDTVTGKVDVDAVNAAANAGSAIASLYDALPKTEGWLSNMFGGGTMSLTDFGTQLTDFGKAVVDFSNTLVEGKIDTTAIQAAVDAGTKMNDLAAALPPDGSIWDWFSSEDKMDFKGFGEQLVDYGDAIVDFSSAISGNIDAAAIGTATTTAVNLSTMLANMGEIKVSTVEAFVSGIDTIKDANVSSFSSAFSNVDLTSPIANVKALAGTLSGIADVNAFKISTFVSSLKNLGEVSVSAIASAFSNGGTKIGPAINSLMSSIEITISKRSSEFKNSGNDIVTNVRGGISTSSVYALDAIKTFVNNCITAISNQYKSFKETGVMITTNIANGIVSMNIPATMSVTKLIYLCLTSITEKYQAFVDAGKYLGDGLVEGIEDKEDEAYDAGYALGQAAVQGEKDGQASESPSKLTIQNGKWLGEGLIIGIDKMGKAVYKSGYRMGEAATDSISTAISKVSDIASGNVDVTPTIRPVYDMTNISPDTIRLGASISSIVSEPVQSLSSIMADTQAKIDASNREVIAAVNKFRDDINAFYSEADDKEIALYVDSKKLASSIAKPMDRQLNILSKRRAYT